MHPFTIEAPPGEDGQRLNNGTTWEWDGNLEYPTFSPSLLCYSSVHLCESEHEWQICEDYSSCERESHTIYHRVNGEVVDWKMYRVPEGAEGVPVHVGPHTRDPAWGNCHSFLRAGRWEFLGDSAHRLAGQTVGMVPLPDWYSEE